MWFVLIISLNTQNIVKLSKIIDQKVHVSIVLNYPSALVGLFSAYSTDLCICQTLSEFFSSIKTVFASLICFLSCLYTVNGVISKVKLT